MKLVPALFSILIDLLILFANPINASTNCDTLLLINGKELMITEHKFHDNKFHYYKCDDELLETKHIIDKKSIVKITVNQALLLKEKELVEAPKKVKKVKKKKAKKKVKKKKKTKYNAYLKLKNGGELKGGLYSRTDNEVSIKMEGGIRRYNFSDLESLKIRKKGKLTGSIALGVLAGVGLTILQLSARPKPRSSYFGSIPDFPGPKESIRIAAASTIGATIVTLIANAKVKIPLSGKRKKRIKLNVPLLLFRF